MQIPLRLNALAPIQTWIAYCRCHSFEKALMYRYASTVSSSAAEVHPSKTSVWWTHWGFWWWLVVFVGFCLLFEACGENIIEKNTASGCPQWKKHGQSLLFCLDALCWMIIKMVLLCSPFQQHALIVVIKTILLNMFYRRGNCDTTQCSDLSHVTLASTWRETGRLWLFVLSKGSITATTWR